MRSFARVKERFVCWAALGAREQKVFGLVNLEPQRRIRGLCLGAPP